MSSPNPNWPALHVQFGMNVGPTSGTPTWTDVTSRVTDLEISRGRQYELDQVQAGTATLTVLDPDEVFNPANGSGPYVGQVLPYRRVLMQAQWPSTNTVAGGPNLTNTAGGTSYGIAYDPSFEATTVGVQPSFIAGVALASTPTVSTTRAFQGSRSLGYTVSNSGTGCGARWTAVCIPGQQYTVSAYVWQTAANSTYLGLDSGPTQGTPTTSINAWVRLTMTFTATQPTHLMSVWTVNTAAASMWVDALQMETGAAASTWSAAGPVIYPLYAGYVERWPSTWNYQGTYGLAQITCVDALAILSQQAVHGEVSNQIITYQPAYYWPLWEPQGASSFAEASGNNGPSLGLTVSKYGPGSGVKAGQSSAIAGDPGGVAAQFFPDQATSSTGTALGCGRSANRTPGISPIPAVPGTAWGVTAAAWVHADAVGVDLAQSGDIVLIFDTTTAAQLLLPVGFFVQFDGTVVGSLGYQVGVTSGAMSIASTQKINDGNWHHLAATVAQGSSNTTFTIYIDGTVAVTSTVTTASLGGMMPASGTSVMVGGENDAGRVTSMFEGEISHVAVWASALPSGQISTLFSAGSGFSGENSGARVTRLATIYSPLPIVADTGASTMGPSTSQNGSFALDVLNDVQVSEAGFLFVDAAGTTRFKSRNSRFLATTSQWTFGELETPYLGDVAYDYDPTQVYNDVEVTRNGGIVVHLSDAASILAYFDRQLTQQISILSDLETIDHTNYLLGRYKQPVQRLNTLTLNPAGNPAVFSVVLGMELNQRATVKRRTPVFAMSDDFFLEKVDHSISFEQGQWTVAVQASPADRQQVWIIGDPVYGQLDVTAICGF